MSDFRVPIHSQMDNQDYEEELDWDNKQRAWSLSERDLGFGKSWIQNIDPTPEKLESLLEFFRIKRESLLPQSLVNLSPGELVLLHQNTTTGPVSLYAALCNKCNQHWYVFRWESDKERWGVYGRNCDFTWRRGQTPSEEEAEMLGRARGISLAISLQPPS